MTAIVDELPDRLTVPEVLRSGVRRWGIEPLLIHNGSTYIWNDVDKRSALWAKGLLALGVTKGSRVGLLMQNSADWVIAFLAATRIGALVSPISTFLQGPELDRVLADGDIQVLLCVAAFLSHDYVTRLEQLPGLADQTSTELFLPSHPFLRRIVIWGACDRTWAVDGAMGLEQAASANEAIDDDFLARVEDSVEPSDLLINVWTSGTTSTPKGVVHTHGTVIRYCHGLHAMGRADVRRGERSYAVFPYFWLGGLNGQVLPSLLGGAVMVTTDDIRPAAVLDTLLRERVMRLTGWLRPLADLQREARDRDVDVSHIRGLGAPVGTDGTPIPPERRGAAFGMTETFGPHSAEPPDAILPPDKVGSMGRAVAGYERQIIDPRDGSSLPPGQVGELRVRGPGMMDGYYKVERSKTFDVDGWFRTGDECSIDAEGHLFWHGRLTEVIKTSGANVAPREIELVLQAFDDIAEAIVFGVPDDVRDEAIVAGLIPVAGRVVDVESLPQRLRDRISNYKIPHRFVLLDAATVPRTDSGKPRKHVLRAQLLHGEVDGPENRGL